MATYIVNSLFVKGFDEEIQFDRAYLYVHKVGSTSWSLEIEEAEQSSIFRNAIRNREHLNITFSAEYMKELKGSVMVKRVTNDSVELKGSGELVSFND
ncbi:hypothetical protein [Bacillus sp. TL12]|uniref:hypothetical protein n=1 Tax=Bacillus sp. TL12 TaxID=2894756 RepID=UPI001F529278|nr:hypothetical protein [Bacillus sp. TL12]MCI0767856.1 hypothetical protein [Bacillus sp. TL12]